MKNYLRAYRAGDLTEIQRDIRPDDAREFSAGGVDDLSSLEAAAISLCRNAITWVSDGAPVATMGVHLSDTEGVGYLWSVATVSSEKEWRFFVRSTPAIFTVLSRGFRLLTNAKDIRNQHQVRWLLRNGFTFLGNPEGVPLGGGRFVEFARIFNNDTSCGGCSTL